MFCFRTGATGIHVSLTIAAGVTILQGHGPKAYG
jgi:hypothetical protein